VSRSPSTGPRLDVIAPAQIFVLEDEYPVRTVIVDALTEAGYAATGFADGAAALEALDAQRPDMIMLDMRMPRMDGFQFLNKLRANPGCTSIPVIIVSGLGEELLRAIDARAAESLGVVGIFAKPFDVPTLVRYIRGSLARGR
jgi:CheY-like chemotaxis protein